ncbi:MAG: hypothetical protein LBU84_12290 [Prevotella sp.]|jgi:hypothetical protein|nr:hypothetical protein [Prevotella sp.]
MQKGDIYNYYNKDKKKCTALQIINIDTDKQEYLLLALSHWDDNPLLDKDINTIKPFWKDHHSWKGEYTCMLCKGDMPDNYSFVGNREVLAHPDEELTKAGSWYYSCLQISLQKAWEELPESFRENYKRLKGIGSNIISASMQKIADGAELDVAYPGLTKIEVDGQKTWLTEYLSTHHNITELIWKNAQEKVFDLSKSRLTTFKTDGKGVEEIILNDCLSELSFLESIDNDIKILPTFKNRSFDLHVQNTNRLYLFRDLNITELWIGGDGQTKIDVGEIAANLSNLKVLRIWGNPDYIVNMEKISLLKNLRRLTLRDIFGFTADNFPSRKDFPDITSIWMDSIPDDVAKKVKKEYKGIDLWITKGRKPEWLEANLNNPFRHWDGEDYISPTHAKKAANLYIKLNKQIDKLIKENLSPEKMQHELEKMVTEYTEEFNKMDKRMHWIDTMLREDIGDVLTKLLEPAKQVYGDKVDFNKLDYLFEDVMDF